jgi:hypothetical protein
MAVILESPKKASLKNIDVQSKIICKKVPNKPSNGFIVGFIQQDPNMCLVNGNE